MNAEAKLTLVTCWFDMRFAPKDMERAMQLLLSVTERIRVKRGCSACTVAKDAGNPDLVLYREDWDSEEFFQHHVRSDEFRRVLFAMDLCCQEPKVQVANQSGHFGMEYLSRLRGKRGEVTE